MLIGLMIMGFGLLFLLRNLNVIYIDDIWQYWPVILIVIGGSKLVSPRGAHDIFPGLVIGGIGTFFLLRNLGVIYGNFWQWAWPLVLIAVGASMLIRHLDGNNPKWGEGRASVSSPDNPALNVDAVFSGAKLVVDTQEFTGGSVDAVFGNADIDLRGAATKLPEVTIKADSVFASIEFRVPETWDVETRGGGIFGNVENRTRKPQFVGGITPPRLLVRADAVFGSVIVRN